METPTSEADTEHLGDKVRMHKIDDAGQLPGWAPREKVVDFFHTTMKPYHDSREDVDRALEYAFSDGPGQGGFLVLAEENERLLGALLMLDTGMRGYVPPNILLFVTVHPDHRGRGLGGRIIDHSLAQCDGDVKLHVEYDNPAKRLYERIGFSTKYAEMRLSR